MPELPEVEVICRGLQPHLTGRQVTAIGHSGKNLRLPVPIDDLKTHLPNRTITSVTRRAKYILITLENSSILVIHLGMTGNLGIFPENSPPAVHDHLQFQLDNNMELRYNDTRRFGSIQIFANSSRRSLEETFFHKTGPEPLDKECTAEYLEKVATGKSQPIKTFLMNGEIIAGVGNIYANETLFISKMHPKRPVGTLSKKEWAHLLANLRKTLNWAIDCGGSTISDFLNASGKRGYFQANFKVYGKNNSPCPICAGPIMKIQLGGRASFFCPECQGQ